MPVRITADGPILSCFDAKADEWIYIPIKSGLFSVLNQRTDIEPGITLQNIFAFVDRDERLKQFIAEYCSCNIDALHKRAVGTPAPIEIQNYAENDEGSLVEAGMVTADGLRFDADMTLLDDERNDEQIVEEDRKIFLTTKANELLAASIDRADKTKDGYVAAIARLPIQLNRTYLIRDWREDGPEEVDEIIFDAIRAWTLLDVLSTIYSEFSEPVFDSRYQAEIDDFAEMMREIRERFMPRNDESDVTNETDDDEENRQEEPEQQ